MTSVVETAEAAQALFCLAVGVRLTPNRAGGPIADAGIDLPAPVQYVCRHPLAPILFAASSNRATRDDLHHVTALAIAPGSGALTRIGEPTPLPSRPIHVTTDSTGRFLLVAYNAPSGLSVHPIAADGCVGSALAQPGNLDFGHFAHQVRMLPSNRTAVLVTRGNDATPGKAEDPGALKLFSFDEGRLAQGASIAPFGGYGFGPRHVDIHPTQPWLYASLERGNALQMFRIGEDDLVSPEPCFATTTLADPRHVAPGQAAGAIHVSGDGRFVHVANRADGKVESGGRMVFASGENSIAVFAIDPSSGEPRLVQSAETGSYHVRTFSLDASGRMLIAASIGPMDVAHEGNIVTVPALLTTFSVGEDGRLARIAARPLDTGAGPAFWCGFVNEAV